MSYSKSRNSQSSASVAVPSCNFCKNAGNPFDHWLKNRDGSISCIILKDIECQFCYNKGHTKSQCTILKKRNQEDERYHASAQAPQAAQAAQAQAQAKPVVKSFATKNAFASLDADSSDEETGKSINKNKKIGGKIGGAEKKRQKPRQEEMYPKLPSKPTNQSTKMDYATAAATPVEKKQEQKVEKVEQKQEQEVESEYQQVGNVIYDHVESTFPSLAKYAGKITKMILDLSITEAKQISSNTVIMNERIFEAMEIINAESVPIVPTVKAAPLAKVKAAPLAKVKADPSLAKPLWSEYESSDDEDNTW